MSRDIMADSSTEAVLSVLDRGEADIKTQQRVSAALLRSQTKQLETLNEIKESLWKLNDLKQLIKEVHDRECSQCPTRKYVEELKRKIEHDEDEKRKEEAKAKSQHQPWYAFLSNPSFQYFLLMVILVWAFIYITAGKEAVGTVKDAATSIISIPGGGDK